ncbi:MAG: nucleotidyltransferase family protein [Prolixibacteraceae bacterium]|nr:nucleotidyltransferase family protein [Prolixibacteraceae bacterium]
MYSQSQIVNFISENKAILEKKYHVSKIGIFGSFARNEQTEESDVDLIIDFKENTNNLFEVKLAIKEFFKEKLNIEVDICREKYIKPRYKNRIIKEAIYVD